ncbi:MAG: hypothetical protein QNJ98_17815 [Planctomycetota bacterium]|nr:hypothetical protein [Planctomycetota bacterium]
MRTIRTLFVLFLVTSLATACGGDDPVANGDSAGGGAPATGKAAEVKAALESLFALAKAEKYEEAAKYVVYSGRAAPERRWKDVSNYGDMVEKAQVDAVCGRLRMAMKHSGAPNFKSFATEKESEGEWLIWTVGFGTGIEEMEMRIACLEVKPGQYGVADID